MTFNKIPEKPLEEIFKSYVHSYNTGEGLKIEITNCYPSQEVTQICLQHLSNPATRSAALECMRFLPNRYLVNVFEAVFNLATDAVRDQARAIEVVKQLPLAAFKEALEKWRIAMWNSMHPDTLGTALVVISAQDKTTATEFAKKFSSSHPQRELVEVAKRFLSDEAKG